MFSLIDYIILVGCILALWGLTVYLRRFTESVADFLSANRLGGRYLLTLAQGAAGGGAISMIAVFEKYYASGPAILFWGMMSIPVGLIIALTGWVIYRFRQTRALTLGQFLEMRYGRKFRIYAAVICYLSGVVNYGIFPAVSGRFFISFLGLPTEFTLFGLALPTLAPVMLCILGFALMLSLRGGQVTIMVTDFIQGQFTVIVLTLMLFSLLLVIDFGAVKDVMLSAPAGKSYVDPFDTGNQRDFNLWFFLIAIFGSFYGTMAWQGSQAYYSSAKSAHEAKMAGILGNLRGNLGMVVPIFVPIIALAIMTLPQFSETAASVHQALLGYDSEQLRKQQLVPVVMSELLPAGVMGLFATVMFFAAVSTDNTYMHSWGSILVQDIIQPLRKHKKPLSNAQHLLLLRCSIAGVAIFAFFFSLFFKQTSYILMFFAITSAIFLGGAGAVIIGGLYSRVGNTAGAFTAMTLGSLIAVSGIVVSQFPYETVAVRLVAPEADAVKIDGQAAREVKAGVWENDVSLMRNDEWRTIRMQITRNDGTEQTLASHYLFDLGRNIPNPMPDISTDDLALLKAYAVTPASGTLYTPKEGILWELFYAVRPINGQVFWFIAMISSFASYFIVSGLTARGRRFDLDHMLHRAETAEAEQGRPISKILKSRLRKRFAAGFSEEFTMRDKLVYFATLLISLVTFGLFIVISAIHLFADLSQEWWFNFWVYYLGASFVIGFGVMIWFLIGGFSNLAELIRSLKIIRRDYSDDGTVRGDEEAHYKKTKHEGN